MKKEAVVTTPLLWIISVIGTLSLHKGSISSFLNGKLETVH